MSDENTPQIPPVPPVDGDGFLQPNPGTEEAPISEPPKKRRGRPPKNPNMTAESPGAAPKAAQTKPGKRGPKMSQEQMGILARQLSGLHMAAAMVTKIGELRIGDDEAKMLASGIADVCEEYGLSLDGKTGAAVTLLGTAAMIYVPRFFAIQARVRQQANNVVDVPHQPV